jgi:hypothetical protein
MLLRQLDAELLDTVAAIAAAYDMAIHAAEPGMRVLIRSEHNEPASEFWVGAFQLKPGDVEAREFAISNRSQVTSTFDACTRALASSGIGQFWAGLSSSTFKGSPILGFNSDDDSTMQLLDRCLRAGRSE